MDIRQAVTIRLLPKWLAFSPQPALMGWTQSFRESWKYHIRQVDWTTASIFPGEIANIVKGPQIDHTFLIVAPCRMLDTGLKRPFGSPSLLADPAQFPILCKFLPFVARTGRSVHLQ